MTISYSYDQIGRNTAITGENSLYGGVSQYAQNLTYRAWGALKAMTYGNNYTLTESFNARLLPSQFEVTKPPAQGSTAVMKTQYHYYADASLKFADRVTTLGQGFDRAFSYDQVSMLKEAYSGGEARDYANGTTGGGPGPYRQTYQHNVFGNLTSRDSRYWDHDDLFSATYVNNRSQDPAWQFDADGRLKQDGALHYNYDAAGTNRAIYNPSINSTTTLLADGDGRQVKRVDAPPGITVTTYYLRSSVLGGRIVAELGAAGQKHRGYVFAGGEVLALQEFGSVTWKHVDPLTGSAAQTKQNGTFTATAELDPSGVNIGVTNPFISPPQFSPEPFFPMLVGDEGSCGSNPNCVRCYFHGSEIPCGLAGHMGSFTKLDPNVASPTTAQRIGWQPIYFDFCLEEPIGAVGGDPQIPAQERTARPCTPQLTGYSEISLGMNLTPIPQDPTGGGAQAGGPTLNTGPRARFDRKRFNKCLQDYFGIEPDGSGGINPFWDRRYGGAFKGIATGNPGHTYTVVTNINKNSNVLAQELNLANSTPGYWVAQSGISLANDVYGRWGVNYIASDVAANPIYLDIGLLAAYAHELGNTLGVETGMPDPYGAYAAENAKFGVSDPDVGAAFERCVFGGLVGLRTGRLGSNREF